MQPDQDQNQDWQVPKSSQSQAPYEVRADEYTDEPLEVNQPVDASPSASGALDDETVLLRWEGTEYLQQDRSAIWYAIAGSAAAVLMVVAYVWFQSITFTILIPIMLAALIIYVRRPPATLHYTLSRKGLHIDDRLYGYDHFRSFGVLTLPDGHNIVVLTPRKRFQISQSIYFPEEVGEQLVDMLAARLPMKDTHLDVIDRFLARLHL